MLRNSQPFVKPNIILDQLFCQYVNDDSIYNYPAYSFTAACIS